MISPPFYRLMNSHFNSIPLGIAYMAAVLNKNGHEAKVYNADYENKKDYANQREIFEEYENYKSILNNLNHPIWKEVKENIEKFSPDVVGLTMLTGTFKSTLNIAKLVKCINKKIMVVVGGVHPTLLPEECAKEESIDYVIVGEGEYSFLELVNGNKLEDIKGLAYKKDGKVVVNEKRPYIQNLDELPFPARDSFLNPPTNPDEYGAIITGRGCPNQCTFCASKKLWNCMARFRSVENVFEEIKQVYDTYGTRFFEFRDDALTINMERAKKLFSLIIESNLKISWTCDTRVDRIDKELLTLMKKAGCSRIKIGVESGSDRILKMVKKGITTEHVRKGVKLIKEVGIPFTIYLMIGFPTETEEEIKETLRLAKELNPNYFSLSILTPYFGTEMYNDYIKNNGNLPNPHWEYFFHQSKDMILNDKIKPKIIDEFLTLNETMGKKRR